MVNLAVFQFDDFIAHTLQKEPVVRHHEQRHVFLREVIFQPFDHFQIQMVCGFVQNQRIRPVDQDNRQRQPLLLAARQVFHLQFQIVQLQLEQNLLELRLKIPRVQLVHLVKRLLIAFRIVGVFQRFFVRFNDFQCIVVRCENRLFNRQFILQIGDLRKKRHLDVLAHHHLPRIRLVLARNDVHDRRLARAILGDERNLLVFVDPKRHVFKQRPLAV